jgi:large subunit ribosomal protein L21
VVRSGYPRAFFGALNQHIEDEEDVRLVFAIVRTGGKQYKVRVGETIDVEKLETEEGDLIRLDQVLLAAIDGEVSVGRPVIDGAVVTAEVVLQGKGPKLIVFKYKSKVRYRRRTGHRQKLTRLNIQSIEIPGWEIVRAPEPAVEAPVDAADEAITPAVTAEATAVTPEATAGTVEEPTAQPPIAESVSPSTTAGVPSAATLDAASEVPVVEGDEGAADQAPRPD